MSGTARFKFRLYIAGDAENSTRARANFLAICDEHLAGRYEVEIIDVFRHPGRALEDGILMTPTLVKLAPSPVRRIVGTLSHIEPVLQAFGLNRSSP
ncbi:MAG: circadian clock KaiB family protein [Betaproteobacteria bacterium]